MKQVITQSALIITATLALTACGGAASIEDLKNDPELLKKALMDCQKMTISEVEKDEQCQNVTSVLMDF